MNFNQFRIFAAVAKHLHITKASRLLHVSQPSISRQLKSLEVAYNAKLYYRVNTGGVELTDEGQLFLGHVHSVLSYLGKLNEIFHSEYRPTSSNLTVGGNYSASATLLPAALRLFKKSHPWTKISLKTANSKDVQQLVLNSEIDIGIVNYCETSPLIAMEAYLYERVLCVVSKHHPLAKRKNLNWSDITATPFVIIGWKKGRGSVEQQILREFSQKGYKVTIAMICESPITVERAVRLEMGLGLLFEDSARPNIQSGQFKEIKLPDVAKMGAISSIIWHSERPVSPDALEFRQLLINLCRKKRNFKSDFEYRDRAVVEWTDNQSDGVAIARMRRK